MRLEALGASSIASLLSVILISLFSQWVLAHTVIQPPQILEGNNSQNYLVITHGCGEADVIGSSIVFPDGVDSTIVVNGNPHTGALSDFIANWGGILQIYQDRSVFSEQDVKRDANGNVVGFWSGGGRTMTSHLFARIPFVSSAILFVPESCAKTVRFLAAAVEVCKLAGIDGINEEGATSFWTPAVGSKYDGVPGTHAYDLPVAFVVNRDLATNPLPESCGTGQTVSITPSAAQINRDLPIQFNGTQVWPQP